MESKYIYVLKYIPVPYFMDSLNCWAKNSRWPTPNSIYGPRTFKTKFEAEEFLFKQTTKKREVLSKWKPTRIKIKK